MAERFARFLHIGRAGDNYRLHRYLSVVSQSALTGLAGWPIGIPIGTPPAAALSRARLSCNLPWISTSRRSTLWWWEAGRGILIRRQPRRAPEAATSSVAAEAALRGQYAEALGATRPDHGQCRRRVHFLGQRPSTKYRKSDAPQMSALRSCLKRSCLASQVMANSTGERMPRSRPMCCSPSSVYLTRQPRRVTRTRTFMCATVARRRRTRSRRDSAQASPTTRT
jgi:hypothetical protein